MPPDEKAKITIGLVGDFSPAVPAHAAIPRALQLAADLIDLSVEARWLPTPCLASHAEGHLAGLDGIWCVPGSPYASLDGALNAIRFAREGKRPFLGTCGGFQHAVLEFARNNLGYRDADHAESNPVAAVLFVTRLACSLTGATGTIRLRPETRVRAIYGKPEIIEQYNCNFGVNPDYQASLETQGMRIAGVDEKRAARIFELVDHPFFIATLFQPELSAFSGTAHPLVAAFARSAAGTLTGVN